MALAIVVGELDFAGSSGIRFVGETSTTMRSDSAGGSSVSPRADSTWRASALSSAGERSVANVASLSQAANIMAAEAATILSVSFNAGMGWFPV